MPKIAQLFLCLNSGTLYPLSTISCSPSKRKSSGKLQSILTWTYLMPKPPPSCPPGLKTQKTEQWIINWGVSSGAPRLAPARLSLLNRFPRKAFNFLKGFSRTQSGLSTCSLPADRPKRRTGWLSPLTDKQHVNHCVLSLFLGRPTRRAPCATWAKQVVLSRKKDWR